jgi:hypothetical protein
MNTTEQALDDFIAAFQRSVRGNLRPGIKY